MSVPYSKVTVIIEHEDQVVTHTFTKARDVRMETSAIEIREGVRPREFLTNSTEVSFDMIADFDPDEGYIMRTTWTGDCRQVRPTTNWSVDE